VINLFEAIIKMYPQVTHSVGDIAYDINNNEVAYDLAAVTAQAQADEAAKQATKDSATSKLKALGLTDDEISALKGTL